METLRQSNSDKVIDILLENFKTRIPWIQRKEISAWSSLIFYYAILWSLGKSSAGSGNSSIHACVVVILLLLISYCFLRFVHAQYQAIYYKAVHADVLEEVLLCMAEDKIGFLESCSIGTPNELLDHIKRQTDEKKRGNIGRNAAWHLFWILFYFWLFWVIVPLQRIFHKEQRRPGTLDNLDNNERGAAALYSLILLGCISSIYFCVKSSPPLARQCWEVVVVICAFFSVHLS